MLNFRQNPKKIRSVIFSQKPYNFVPGRENCGIIKNDSSTYREYFMKFLLSLTASVLSAAALLSVLPVSGEHQIYNDVLRLHVLAESDSDMDQTLKLHVRDAVLACVSGAVAECDTFEEAKRTVGEMQSEIYIAARTCVRENGSNCRVTVTLAPETYPRRDYGSSCLPAGEYLSLKITLGEGAGKNWWCILFPTVCVRFAQGVTDEETYIAAGFTPEEYRVITGEGEWKVKFRILEILSELFSGKSEKIEKTQKN